jgi:hypothetical protein
MFKKILLWSLYIAFAGGLVFAGINRTSATLSESSKNNQNHGGDSTATDTVATVNIASSESIDEHDAQTHEWVILHAEVIEATERNIVIQIEDGSLITINPRPWRFACEQGFSAAQGDKLLVTGFYEPEKLEIVHLRNLENASVAQIRDEEGHPLWNSNNGS